jgi:hypothetical protein
MATTGSSAIIESLKSTADLSAKANEYKLVKPGATDGTFILCAVLGEKSIGVLCDRPLANQAGAIMIAGKGKVQLGATVATGANFMTDATGRAILATSTNFISGTILTGGAVGEVVECIFQPQGKL